MKKHLLILIIICIAVAGCKMQVKDGSVGEIDTNGFSIDSVAIKSHITEGIKNNIKNFEADKTEIIKIKTIGEKNIDAYFAQCTDTKNNTRVVKYLFLKDNKFYFVEDIKGQKQNDPDEIFYRSYYASLNNLLKECRPNIAIIEGEYMWGLGDKIACDINSPCLGQHIVNL